jgi:PAS domain S-box-containing protein
MELPQGFDNLESKVRYLERFRRMVEESPAIIWAFDEVNGRMLYLNPATEEILGFDKKVFFEKPAFWFELIHPDDRPHASALNHVMREEKRVISYSLRFRCADGRYVELTTVVRPIYDGKGRLVRTEGAAVYIGAGDD